MTFFIKLIKRYWFGDKEKNFRTSLKSRVHPLGEHNFCTKFTANSSSRFCDISLNQSDFCLLVTQNSKNEEL